jgi:RNA polymerase nonessential primary-like sigma factor
MPRMSSFQSGDHQDLADRSGDFTPVKRGATEVVLELDDEFNIDSPSHNVSVSVEYADAPDLASGGSRNTTDLVRLYLQEIGKVDLLGRDEEVFEAQQVQRYMDLLEQRQKAAQEDELLQRCVQLVHVRDNLTSRLGHRPSLERWAKEGGN